MYETTQIPYGDGTITVIMITESTTEIPASDIRFGRYLSASEACFTEKELGEIYDGDNAELRFYYVIRDELDSQEEEEKFDQAISLAQEDVGSLHKGFYYDVLATKTIGDDDPIEFSTFYDDIEMQLDIPLYLSAEGREYYLMTNNMGAIELEKDIDHDAVTLSVSTKALGTSLILYQDQGEGIPQKEGGFQIKSRYLFVVGIVVLAAIWIAMEVHHKRERDD